MSLLARFGLYALGITLLVVWIVVCAAGFWFLLRATPQGISDEYVSSLAWPFVAVLIAVPTIGVLLVGGLSMLGQVLTLRTFLSELPGQVTSLDKLTSQMGKQSEKFETLKVDIEEAAGTIDLASSQLADLQAAIDTLNSSAQPGEAQVNRGENLVEEFKTHLSCAMHIFNEGAARYLDQKGVEVDRTQGWILESSVRQMKDAGSLDSRHSAYVTALIDLDRRTRRSGRKNLRREDIDLLNRLRPDGCC
ncbi:hypothetical protein WNY37_06895 [Henriciella sp. AS95]|uniref:hypothetical protein n=1 Tax=Henriciella sp. AS95 TaxID=3135782 RepID=UPI00317C2E93